jgi:hypothetical protein
MDQAASLVKNGELELELELELQNSNKTENPSSLILVSAFFAKLG